ncbi:MAG: hypothetical protein J5J00_08720 [Deltaproteobacteria bacterium]|nr:hypothetical protein [Deltaproteobacteria bacterium]
MQEKDLGTDTSTTSDAANATGAAKNGSPEYSSEKSAAAEASETPRAASDVSAYAIARMMGVATTSEVKVLEGKLDLVTTRVTNMGVKLDRVLNLFQQMPTGSDLERIDVQIGSLKTLLRDLMALSGGEKVKAPKQPPPASSLPSATEIITSEEGS